jgi:hypothetical protein
MVQNNGIVILAYTPHQSILNEGFKNEQLAGFAFLAE